ncbi:MAG: methionine--tRNA ligase subunit beta [Halobacteria archaeon]
MAEPVSIDEFQRLDLRVGRVVRAEPLEGSKKLVKVTVSLGEGERTLVAGIREHYPPEGLPGKSVIVVANLKPARIFGVESRGMLLAAEGGGKLALLAPDREMEPGSRIR